MDVRAENEQLRAIVAAKDVELVAERGRRVELEAQVAKLAEAVRELRALLDRNSSNSNKPPSSDPPGTGATPSKKKLTGRRRGGQKGHRGSYRVQQPSEKVDEVMDLFPPECASCWTSLRPISDPLAKRYQFTELNPTRAHTTEYRRHSVCCPECGFKTRAAYDEAVIPRFVFGPRLSAVVAMLTGVYHLSRRETVHLLWELLGVRMSLGSVSAIEKRVSEFVAPAVDEAWEKAREALVKHTDGTSWLRAGVMLSLWTLATTAVTVFKIVAMYGKRFTIEESFRDTKDPRYGLGLADVHIKRPDRRDRMLLIAVVAQALLTLLGAAAEAAGLDKTMKANTVTKRTHSLFRQGWFWYRCIPNMREDWFVPLMTHFDRIVREQRVHACVEGLL